MVRGMTSILSSRSLFQTFRFPALLAASVLIVSGCAVSPNAELSKPSVPEVSTSDQSSGDENNASLVPENGQTILMMAGQSFTFTPTTCLIGDDQQKVTGAGFANTDRAPVFLDISITKDDDGWPTGVVHVYFDAKNAGPTDNYVIAAIGDGDNYGMSHALNGYEIEAFFRNVDGVPTSTGTFTINCEK